MFLSILHLRQDSPDVKALASVSRMKRSLSLGIVKTGADVKLRFSLSKACWQSSDHSNGLSFFVSAVIGAAISPKSFTNRR